MELKVYEMLSTAALLEQCAEECTELSQACLKLARKERDENPTPKSREDILANLTEEIADVAICIREIVDSGLVSPEGIDSWIMNKELRWKSRLTALGGEKHV